MTNDDLTYLQSILTAIKNNPDSTEFRNPVDWKGLGLYDYPALIKHPMDLTTCIKNLKAKKYVNVEDCINDI